MARWGLAAVAVGIVAGGTLPGAVAGVAAVWEANRASLPWLFERALGYVAYLAMTGSVIYGLLLSTGFLDALAHRPISFALHQDLAAIGAGLAGVHGFLLGLDRTVPFSIAAILIPGQSPHAPLAVALGQVSLYLSLAVIASFYLRRRIGQRAWRTLHFVTFLAFTLATAHGILAGSDTGSAWAAWLYTGAAAIVTFLLVVRIGLSMATRLAPAVTPPPRTRRANAPGAE
jgi:sulfoxide reductase heme-binding subunit YedZ